MNVFEPETTKNWGKARASLLNALSNLDDGVKTFMYLDQEAQTKYLTDTKTGLGDYVDMRARLGRTLSTLIASVQLAQAAENNAFVEFLGHNPCLEPDSEDWWDREIEKDLDIRGLF